MKYARNKTDHRHSYARIIVRISEKPAEAERKAALMLLGWVACAKRPLKWYEIQGLRSVDIEKQSVDFARRRFVIGPKDLCESLLEVYEDGSVELVHSTAK